MFIKHAVFVLHSVTALPVGTALIDDLCVLSELSHVLSELSHFLSVRDVGLCV